MEKEFFELLGLGVPFYIAAATYAVFSWLDNNASDDATNVISSWLHGRSQHKPDLGNVIINAFDRVYTSPLLSFRAFRRSAAISSIIWSLVFLVPWLVRSFSNWSEGDLSDIFGTEFVTGFAIPIFVNSLGIVMLTDYVSLLFVRRFLNAAQKRPIAASLLSSAVGLVVVAIGSFVFSFFFVTIFYYILGGALHKGGAIVRITKLLNLAWWQSVNIQPVSFGLVPAFIIHLWLPLFALSSLTVQLVFWVFRAVEWAQWFLKQGDAHPLKVIGFVATIIVFGSAMLVKEGWALLSVLERS
jgi:hypothetical protein